VSNSSEVFARLMGVIESRKGAAADASYTASLFAGGIDEIGAKIGEEAGEVIGAAHEQGESGRTHLVNEAADLIFHLFVMMAHRGVSLAEVEAELARRFGVSGHDEKAGRKR